VISKNKKKSSFSGLPEYFQIFPEMFQILPDNFQAGGKGQVLPPPPPFSYAYAKTARRAS